MHIPRHQVIDTLETHTYIYADDASEKAMRGQAATFGMMPNALPIFTRLWCCEDRAAQVYQMPLHTFKEWIEEECFERIRWVMEQSPHKIFIVVPKIGEGCSQLKQAAPEYYKVIAEFLDSISNKTQQ